jgi:hypothetical protein
LLTSGAGTGSRAIMNGLRCIGVRIGFRSIGTMFVRDGGSIRLDNSRSHMVNTASRSGMYYHWS